MKPMPAYLPIPLSNLRLADCQWTLSCLLAACLIASTLRAATPAELESLITRHQTYLATAPASQERAAALAVLVDYLAAEDRFVRQLTERYCYRADPAEFDAPTRARVATHFIGKRPLKKPDILLLDQIGAVPQLLADPDFVVGELDVSAGRWYNTPAWGLLLAQARQGDPLALSTVLARVSAEPSRLEKTVRLLPDLAYVRQPQAIAVLQDELFSEQCLPGATPGLLGTPVAHWAAHLLAEVLDGCPLVQLDHPADYDPAQIEALRTWILEQ